MENETQQQAVAPADHEATAEPQTDIRVVGSPDQRAKLWEAMGKARAEFDEVTKSLKGQTGNQTFKYTSFAMLSGAMVKPLAAHGLSILQMVTTPKADVGCVTTLLAGHGAELWVTIMFATSDNEHGFQATIKDFGTATTYYKRYQLQAIGFIEGDRDPDETGDNLRGPARSGGDGVKGGTPDPMLAEVRKAAEAAGLTRGEVENFAKTKVGIAKRLDGMNTVELKTLVAALQAETKAAAK